MTTRVAATRTRKVQRPPTNWRLSMGRLRSLSSPAVHAGQRAQVKLPGQRTRKARLDTLLRLPKVGAGQLDGGKRRRARQQPGWKVHTQPTGASVWVASAACQARPWTQDNEHRSNCLVNVHAKPGHGIGEVVFRVPVVP